MGLHFDVREISYATESAFSENDTSPSSNTWTKRIPVLSASFTASHPRMSDMSMQTRANHSRPGFLGVRSGTFEFTTYHCGHILTAATTLTENWFQDLLSDSLGTSGGDVTCVGTTIVGAASTATSWNVTSSAGITAGDIVRCGAKGDGKGDGQAGLVGTSAGNVLTMLTGAAAAPVTAGHVVYATATAFPTETLGPTKRFLCAYSTTGAQYHFMGCQAESISFKYEMGQLPEVTFKYRVAYWTETTTSFPAVAALESVDTAPFGAGGSVFINDVGTATRAIESPSAITLTLDMPLADKLGPSAGQANYRIIAGYERLYVKPSFTMTIPWSASPDYVSAYASDGPNTTAKHILVTGSATNKKAYGFYLPNAYYVSDVPTVTNNNGMLYRTVSFQGAESSVTTNDKTRQAIKFFQG